MKTSISSILRFYGSALLIFKVVILSAGVHLLQADDQKRILFSSLTDEDGLGSGKVSAVVQGNPPYVWLATRTGLYQHDGKKVIPYLHDPGLPKTISSNQLTAMVKDSSGRLWIGTADAGLNAFDRDRKESRRFFVDPDGGEGLSSNEITSLAISEDQFLWIGTRKGLNVLHLKSEKFKESPGIPPHAHITAIAVLQDELLWVGTASGDLFRWSGDGGESTFELFWSTGAPITDIEFDLKKGLWVGTEGKGLFQLDPATARARQAPLDERDITDIHVDSNSDLWVGTQNGLAQYNRLTGDFVMFRHRPNEKNSLSHNHISTIFEGEDKTLWIGTHGGGASWFGLDLYLFPHHKRLSEHGDSDQLPDNSVWGMAAAETNKLWIATRTGLSLWNPVEDSYENLDLTSLFEGVTPYVYSVLETRSGDVWAGTKGDGLVFLPEGDVERATVFTHDPNDPNTIGHDFVTTIFEDSHSRIWLGTNGAGLWEFLPESQSFRFIEVNQEVDEAATEEVPEEVEWTATESTRFYIRSISESPKGRLWIGASDGIHLLDRKLTKTRSLRDSIPEHERLTSDSVTCVLAAEQDTVYIGTEKNGLNILNSATGKVRRYQNSNSHLPGDEILAILQDQDGMIWISTDDGIARLNPATNKFRVFDEFDGIQDRSLHEHSAAMSQDGFLHFGGANGFHRIDPQKLPRPQQPPLPILTEFEMFGEIVVPEPGGILEKRIMNTSRIEVPFDERNKIGFRFGDLGSRFPGRNRFRYQLVNHDESWVIDEKDNRRATYHALRPGEYEFKVQSSPDGRSWNSTTVGVTLVITPPWYNTWWARALFIAALVSGAVGTVRFMVRSRLKQIERREEQLTAQRDRADAALAKQLQNAVLLDRTSREFRHDLRGEAIFKTPLANLGEHFKTSRCLLRIRTAEDDCDASPVTISEYCAEGIAPVSDAPLSLDHTICKKIMASDKPVACEFLDSNPDFLPVKEELRSMGVKSFLAVRTSFLDRPNGILVLHQCDRTRPWTEDETKLIQSVAAQFGVAIAQRDLTLKEEKYREELENARHNAEVANKAKSEFLAKMTHELRTPLNAIIGFSQVIREDDGLAARQREIVDIINNSGEHLLDVINDILDVSKIEAGKVETNLEQFELEPLLQSVREMLEMKAESKGISFEFSKRTQLPNLVETDRSKLRQVLINLLGNGIKFTDKGAIGLTCQADVVAAPFQIGSQWRRKVKLTFDVRDTGRGIDQTELPKLFEKFSQTETGRRASEGTGLGLPIARSFVRLLGGDIEVMSKVGFGTTFRFSIECDEIADATEKNAKGESVPVIASGNGPQIVGLEEGCDDYRILIAEDQPVNRLLLSKVLAKAGFNFEEAVNGREAYEKWKEWNPHLILMDEDMPIMKGSEATRAIIEECEDNEKPPPVIISLTAYAFEQAREKAIAAGCKDFIAKPFKSHELYATIAKHLDLKYKFASMPERPAGAPGSDQNVDAA